MHIMIDFETLSLKPNAVVTQLAAIVFDLATGEIHDKLHIYIDPRVQPGRDISADTVLWWMDQDADARRPLTEALAATDLIESGEADDLEDDELNELHDKRAQRVDHAAQTFVAWYNAMVEAYGEPEGVWSCGGIDHTWMENLLDYAGLKNPIKYWLQRDYRTPCALVSVPKPEFIGTKHNALHDAENQARHLAVILKYMREGGTSREPME